MLRKEKSLRATEESAAYNQETQGRSLRLKKTCMI
jgi:hypothetical protein